MAISSATVSAFSQREPFKSVGLTCACGRNVVGFEGMIACACGAVYVVSVSVIRPAP